jgi:predicted nucleotidyltransferase
MTDSWYTKYLPKVKEIAASLPNIVKDLQELPHVESIYVFGSVAKNFTNPDFRAKDIDVALKLPFHSEDLVAINQSILNNKISSLEEEGFDIKAVSFSKALKKFPYDRIDPWAISSDNKLLHWGPIIPDKEESIALKTDAEEHAENETGIKTASLQSASEPKRHNWYKVYDSYLNSQMSNMPSGWYLSDDIDAEELISTAMKLK